jgi:hypothetical protein
MEWNVSSGFRIPYAVWTLRRLPVSLATAFFIFVSPCESTADELERGMISDMRESRVLVINARQSMGRDGSCSGEITLLKNKGEGIRAAHILLKERLAGFSTRAEGVGGKALDRQNAVVEGYVKALEEYLALLDAIPPDGTVSLSTLESLLKIIDTITPRKKLPIIGTLPYSKPRYPAREPDIKNPVTPAYLGGNQAVATEDTYGSPEAPVSDEIARQAESLSFSPVLIYEWVKNNVDTEWYYGCMKGAEETLRQKSGNDCDQAALLTALLRASRFPTRYVRGVAEFFPDIEKAKSLTGISDPKGIASFFQRVGIPFKPVIAGGGIENFLIEHVWVESLIPYSNYRGVVMDDQGKTWIALDTSIKPPGFNWSSPVDLTGFLSLDTLRDEYLQTTRTETPLEFLRQRAEERLSNNGEATTWQELLRRKSIIPETLKILPSSLQFRQTAITGEYSSIPDMLLHKIRITASGEWGVLFSVTKNVFELSGRKIVINYEPESIEDQRIIDSYGGLDNTPPYLVRLRPLLKVGDERVVVAEDGLPMGGDYTLTIEAISANGTEKSASAQIVGNIAAIAVVAQRVSDYSRPDPTDSAETLLYKEARGYVGRWNRSEDEFAALLGLSLSRPFPTVATVGNQIDVTWLLDSPHDFQWKGVLLDANMRGVEVVAGNGDAAREKSFMRLCSLEGSILENRIFEEDFQVESVSTAKLLQQANAGGIPIVTIGRTNVADLLPTLPFDDSVKGDITDAVNQGYTVRIPRTEMAYEDWSGVGYIKEDPDTGESGWMLSGMVAGGMSAVGVDRWNEYYRDGLMTPFSEPHNRDPSSAASIQKITATDLQFGDVGAQTEKPLQVKVKDKYGNPVTGVEVTFTIRAGGGSFDGGATSRTEKTDNNGIAEVALTLGQRTADNPTYFIEEGDDYYSQYGVNIVDAALPSGTSLTVPFTVYGMPRTAVNLRKVHGDENIGMILSYAGFVGLIVEDQFGNPIANQPVTFSVGAMEDKSNCDRDEKDPRPALLIKNGDQCLSQFLTYSGKDQCDNPSQSKDAISDIRSRCSL